MRRNNKALYEKIMRNVSREVKKALNEMESALDYLPQPGVDYDPDDNRYTRNPKYKDICVKALQYDLDSDYEDAEQLYDVILKYEDECNNKFLNDERFEEMYTDPFFAMLMLTISINHRSRFDPFYSTWFEEEGVWRNIVYERSYNEEFRDVLWKMADEVKNLNLTEQQVFAIFQWWGVYSIEDIEKYAETGNI